MAATTLTACPQCSGAHTQPVPQPDAAGRVTLATCARCAALGYRTVTTTVASLWFYGARAAR